jgi:F0F1-type ATP synthase membrane subunit c/vacuolar-type H+-ATPase subunit K
MEKQVGIEPQTSWDTFRRTDMVPVFGGVATGVVAGDIVDTLLNAARKNKLTQSVKWYKNYPAMTGVAAGLAVERMTEKYLENIMKQREELYNENNSRKTI